MKNGNKIGIDAPRVTRDEAVELMVHHLALAASYFEATPDDNGQQVQEEIERSVRDGNALTSNFLGAAKSFNNILVQTYNKMKEKD